LAALKLEDSNDTAKDGHALSKRSRSAIVDYNPKRKQQKRSLETLSRQLSTEIQILEEGDFTGDIEQVISVDLLRLGLGEDFFVFKINEKRRKRSPRPEAEDFLDGVWPSQNFLIFCLASTQWSFLQLLPKDPRGLLSKRSLKEEKGKGASSGSCWDEPREKCTSIPKEVCETVAEEICTDVPREVCEEVESCKDLPKKDCEIIYKEVLSKFLHSKLLPTHIIFYLRSVPLFLLENATLSPRNFALMYPRRFVKMYPKKCVYLFLESTVKK